MRVSLSLRLKTLSGWLILFYFWVKLLSFIVTLLIFSPILTLSVGAGVSVGELLSLSFSVLSIVIGDCEFLIGSCDWGLFVEWGEG